MGFDTIQTWGKSQMRVYIMLVLVQWSRGAKLCPFKRKSLHYGPKGKRQDTTNPFQCVACLLVCLFVCWFFFFFLIFFYGKRK